jgi:hypothetical protein
VAEFTRPTKKTAISAIGRFANDYWMHVAKILHALVA